MKQIKVDLSFFTIIFLLALFFVIVGPFVQIWAINTLFQTSIQYSWLNWFCMLILNSSFGAVSYRGK